MAFLDSLYDKIVDNAKNTWTALTTPTTGNILEAGKQAKAVYEGLSTPSTKAATQQKVVQLKAAAPTAKVALEAKQSQQLKDIINVAQNQPTQGSILNAFMQVKSSYEKLQQPAARPAETARLEANRQAGIQQQLTAYKQATPLGKIIRQTGGEFGAGLVGKPKLPEMTTGSKVADTIIMVLGQGLGFITAGELTGAAAAGTKVEQGLLKLAPILKTQGMKLVPRLAANVAKFAVRGGVEMELLSGIHSVLNADTQEQALARAKEYGLFALVGAPIGAVGGELLGALAKALKPAVASKTISMPLKGHVEPYKVEMPPLNKELIQSAHKIAGESKDAVLLNKVANVLREVVENPEKHSPRELTEAKLKLIDIKKMEMSKELVPEIKKPAEKTYIFTGKNGERITGKLEPIPGRADEFYIVNPKTGEKQWGKNDYWNVTEKVPTAELKIPETVTSEKILYPIKPGPIPKLKSPKKQNFMENLYQKMWDESYPIERLSKQVGETTIFEKAVNIRRSSAITRYVLDKGLVDKEGNVIGKALREVIEDRLPTDAKQLEQFWRAFLDAPPSLTSKGIVVWERPNVPKGYEGVAKDLEQWIGQFLEAWRPNANNSTMSKAFEYLKTNLIKPDGSLANPIEQLIKFTDNTIRTEKYNDIMLELGKIADAHPEIIRDVSGSKTKFMANTIDGIGKADGSTMKLQVVDDQLFDSLKGLLKVAGEPNVFKKIVNFMKNIITVQNPLFAMRNFFKDLTTALVKSEKPIEVAKGYLKPSIWKEAFQGGGLYERVGGGGELFFRTETEKTAKELAGTIGKKITYKTPFQTVGKGISWLNEGIESIPRVIEFNRVLKETGNIDKALVAAGDITVNFSRGGKWSKSVGEIVPYFNAGMQGLDNFARSFSPKKLLGTFIKGGVVITLPKVVQWVVNNKNPNYQKLDTNTKDNYFIIPNGDPNSTEKFWKIPVSKEFNVLFGAILGRVVSGEGLKVSTIMEQVKQMLPPNLLKENVFSGIMGYYSNWDFYFGNPIVSVSMTMGKVPGWLQFDDKTNKLIVKLSQLAHDKFGLDLSPIKIQALIEDYTGELGQIALDMPNLEAVKKDILGKWTTSALTSSQAMDDFYKLLDKVGGDYKGAQITKATNVDELKAINSELNKASTQISDLRKAIATETNETRKTELTRQMNAVAEGMVAKYGGKETKPLGGIVPKTGGKNLTPSTAKKTTTSKAKTTTSKKSTTSKKLKSPKGSALKPGTSTTVPKAGAKTSTVPRSTVPKATGGGRTAGGRSVLEQYVEK